MVVVVVVAMLSVEEVVVAAPLLPADCGSPAPAQPARAQHSALTFLRINIDIFMYTSPHTRTDVSLGMVMKAKCVLNVDLDYHALT